MALQLWDLQGQPSGGCASQAVLVDVSPALNQTVSPKRTGWARAAVLYNLLRSYDLAETESLRSAISNANFGSMQDGPISNGPTNFKFAACGFQFDAVAMTVAADAVNWTTGVDTTQVDTTQVERVGFVAGRALDRMYSFATGKSNHILPGFISQIM